LLAFAFATALALLFGTLACNTSYLARVSKPAERAYLGRESIDRCLAAQSLTKKALLHPVSDERIPDRPEHRWLGTTFQASVWDELDHWTIAFYPSPGGRGAARRSAARFETCLSEYAPWALVSIATEPFVDFR
jgi:hypothetical protein